MKQNVFILVIDSLRFRNLLGKNTTCKIPNIENLIKNGVSFSNAFSSADGTVLSSASILSGMYPFHTGVTQSSHYQLDDNVTHMATFFKNSGYDTNTKIPELTFLKGLADDFENNDKFYNNYYELSKGFGKEILKKLDLLSKKEPWFFYAHINDLHLPTWPSKKFDHEDYGASNYDRVISEIDYWIGEFLKKIDLKNTLVILSADHGEYLPFVKKNNQIISFESGKIQQILRKFGAKIPKKIRQKLIGFFSKSNNSIISNKISQFNLDECEKRSFTNTRKDSNYLFDELLHIPLIFSGPNIKNNSEINNLVSHVDIFPTIAELLDLKIQTKIDGTSLLPLINGHSIDEKFVYFERDILLKKPENDVIGIRNNAYKYFRPYNNSSENLFLFDLINDPNEEKNISKTELGIVNKMEKHLNLIIQQQTRISQSSVDEEYSKKVEDELKKLGYI